MIRAFLSSVRARATIGATLIVAIALALTLFALFGLLRQAMFDNVDATLELRAEDIAAFIDEGDGPDSLAIAKDDDAFVQLIEADGTVLIASDNVAGEAQIVDGSAGSFFSVAAAQLPIGSETFRVHISNPDDDSDITIIVGQTIDELNDVLNTFKTAALVGSPILLLLVAVTVWGVVGRTLRPVEAIRAEVAEIGGTGLHRRVPEPASRDEISKLAVTMNAMLDRLESSNARQQRFVSDASHELRTPIATIRHELEVALLSDTPDWHDVATDVLEEDIRMQRIVEDLLWLARHDHAGDTSREPYVLVDLDEVTFDEARRNRPGTGIALSTAGISAGQVWGNSDELSRVVRNLIDNAYTHAESKIAVAVSTDERGVVLWVDDDGPGVPEESRIAILERFTRTDESRARGSGGFGLGLAIANEIILSNDGNLAVLQSPTLGGARFEVTLPDARRSPVR